jgi:hypothetical protein
VRAHVDQLRGTFHGLDRGIDNILGRRHKRDYGPVVVRVDMRIQHAGGPHRRDGRRYLFDRLRPSPFAKIWNTLDYRKHSLRNVLSSSSSLPLKQQPED